MRFSSDISRRWKQSWTNRRFRKTFVGTMAVLVVTLAGFRQFLDWVQDRPGVILNDPLLDLIDPVDLTWLTFAIIYGGIIVAAGMLAAQPDRLVRAVQAYAVMVGLRTVCMFFVPLDPPPGTIPLQDPFVQMFGSGNAALTRDLFFSGHTATLVLLGLCMGNRNAKRLFMTAAVVVGIFVIVQHVHYTIDVLVAPMAASIAVWLVERLPHVSVAEKDFSSPEGIR